MTDPLLVTPARGRWFADMPTLDGVQANNEVGDRFYTPISHVLSDLEGESINVNAIAPEVAAQSVEQGPVERIISCREFDEKKWHIVNGKKMRRKKDLQAYLVCHRGEPKFKRKHARSRRSAGSKKNVACKYRAYVAVYQDEPNVYYLKILHDHTGHVPGSAEDLRYTQPDAEAMTFIKEVRPGLLAFQVNTDDEILFN